MCAATAVSMLSSEYSMRARNATGWFASMAAVNGGTAHHRVEALFAAREVADTDVEAVLGEEAFLLRHQDDARNRREILREMGAHRLCGVGRDRADERRDHGCDQYGQ